METKFKKRMNELSTDLEKNGRNVNNSKLYNSIQEKMLNTKNIVRK